MTKLHDFTGHILDATPLMLGEGPSYDPQTDTAWWLNIIEKELHSLHLSSGKKTVYPLPFMASMVARIDADRQLLATDAGLFIRDMASSKLTPYLDFEPGKPENRSNDGRVHPCGALWIGTMGRKAQTGAGAIYHVAQGVATRLYDTIGITNSICFSPDGAIGYFTDSKVNALMRVALDPQTGLPIGAPSVLADTAHQPGDMDGSVCDANGHIWNARWGQGALDRYDADGRHLDRYRMPASQVTCPAFIGADAGRLLVTSAREGLDTAAYEKDRQAGYTFDTGLSVDGRFEPAYRL